MEEQMVGSAVNRAFLPAKSLFEQVGEMMLLTARTIVSSRNKSRGTHCGRRTSRR